MGTVVIAVRVGDDRQSGKVVTISKHRSWFHSVPGVPNREPVAEQVFCCTANPELNLQLPVSRSYGLKI